MRKFAVCIRGKNFLMKKDNKIGKTAFYAARSVEADDTSAAIKKVMDSFRADLRDEVLNDQSDMPVMTVEEISEVYYFQDEMIMDNKTLPTKGYIWDPDEDALEETILEHQEEMVKPISSWRRGWPALKKNLREKDLHVHSMAIHFTNGLFPIAILFMFLALTFDKDSFRQTYFYLMLIATITSPISYATGLFEWKRKHQKAMVPIFMEKIRFGVGVFIIGGLCTLWNFLSPGVLADIDILTVPFVLLNLLMLPLLLYLGHLGGIIVYEGVE